MFIEFTDLPPGLAPWLTLLPAEPPGPRTGPGTQEVLATYLLKEYTGPPAAPPARRLQLGAHQGVGEGIRPWGEGKPGQWGCDDHPLSF